MVSLRFSLLLRLCGKKQTVHFNADAAKKVHDAEVYD